MAKRITLGEDLEEYRRLLDVPAEFEDGFNLRTVLGALFIGFVMMPASIYLSLVAGQQLGEAAQWTTLILFTEIAKRSFSTVKKQEIFIIFYMAGGLAAAGGGPIGGMMWSTSATLLPPWGSASPIRSPTGSCPRETRWPWLSEPSCTMTGWCPWASASS